MRDLRLFAGDLFGLAELKFLLLGFLFGIIFGVALRIHFAAFEFVGVLLEVLEVFAD